MSKLAEVEKRNAQGWTGWGHASETFVTLRRGQSVQDVIQGWYPQGRIEVTDINLIVTFENGTKTLFYPATDSAQRALRSGSAKDMGDYLFYFRYSVDGFLKGNK